MKYALEVKIINAISEFQANSQLIVSDLSITKSSCKYDIKDRIIDVKAIINL